MLFISYFHYVLRVFLRQVELFHRNIEIFEDETPHFIFSNGVGLNKYLN